MEVTSITLCRPPCLLRPCTDFKAYTLKKHQKYLPVSSVTYTELGKLQEAVEMDLQAVSWLLPARIVFMGKSYQKFCLEKWHHQMHKSPGYQALSRDNFHENMQSHSGSGAPQRLGLLLGDWWARSRQSHGGPIQQLVIVLLQAKCGTKWPEDKSFRQLRCGFINFLMPVIQI